MLVMMVMTAVAGEVEREAPEAEALREDGDHPDNGGQLEEEQTMVITIIIISTDSNRSSSILVQCHCKALGKTPLHNRLLAAG